MGNQFLWADPGASRKQLAYVSMLNSDAIAAIAAWKDVDINLIRECNEMLQRDLEKYEEMVSHWSGASTEEDADRKSVRKRQKDPEEL